MTHWIVDDDTVIALVAGFTCAACVLFAVRRFYAGRRVAGAVWSIGAAALGFVAWFFATFTMRMF